MATVVKVTYDGTMCRFTLPARNLNGPAVSLADLQVKVRDLFNLPPGRLVLTYKDRDGDVVTMASDADVKDACVVQGLNPLYITVKLAICVNKQPSGAPASDGSPLTDAITQEAARIRQVVEVAIQDLGLSPLAEAATQLLPSYEPLLVELWDNFRGSDWKPSSHLKVPQWKLLFTQSFPVPYRHGMYIRDGYADLYDSVMKSFEKREGESEMRFVHVNGTPGIGKSMFMWYIVLREASKQSCDIFLRRHGYKTTLVFPRQGKAYCVAAMVRLRPPEDGNVLYLIDQRYAALGHYKYNVIFASPDETNYKEATKVGKFCTKYMPSVKII